MDTQQFIVQTIKYCRSIGSIVIIALFTFSAICSADYERAEAKEAKSGYYGEFYYVNRGDTISDGNWDNVYVVNGCITGGNFKEVINHRNIHGGNIDCLYNVSTVNDCNVNVLLNNSGTINGGNFSAVNMLNEKIIIKGAKNPVRYAVICGGIFTNTLTNDGIIDGGTFTTTVTNNYIINGGTFDGAVTGTGTITGGTFNSIVSAGAIIGGTFQNDPSSMVVSGYQVVNTDSGYKVVPASDNFAH